MANDDSGDKTELPTDRRRAEAREKGNVARSSDLTSAGMMLAAATALSLLGIPTARDLAQVMQTFLQGPGWLTINPEIVMEQFWSLFQLIAGTMFPLLLLMVLSALALNFVQVGFLLSPEALQPKFDRINPLSGAKRLLSIRALVRLAASLGKLLIVAALAIWSIHSFLPTFLSLMGAEPPQILRQIESSLIQLAYQLAGALIALAILDFAFQIWKHEQDMKMSKQEVREEMKNMEGDPMIRQRRKEAHRKLAQARELQQVEHADVVITNPTHIAVALKYDAEFMPAPKVIAKGMGELAHRIRQIASEHRVPIIERKPLARSLNRDVKVGQFIPVEMYEVFVEIMAYVYKISGRTPTNLS